jgi:beta-galactosidase
MYLPGPWLKRGRNEVVVLDLTGPQRAELRGLETPILDRLQPERDLPRPPNKAKPKLEGVTPAFSGQFQPGSATQDVRFAAPVSGRQFCLESLDAFDGKQYAAVAEISLLDAKGQPINQSAWTIAYVSSEEGKREDGQALNAINGQASDFWHTAFAGKTPAPAHPHRLVIDLEKTVEVAGIRYTPRQGDDKVTSRIKRFNAYVGAQLVDPGE